MALISAVELCPVAQIGHLVSMPLHRSSEFVLGAVLTVRIVPLGPLCSGFYVDISSVLEIVSRWLFRSQVKSERECQRYYQAKGLPKGWGCWFLGGGPRAGSNLQLLHTTQLACQCVVFGEG